MVAVVSISHLYQPDPRFGDSLLRPQRWCGHMWQQMRAPLTGHPISKLGQVIIRIVSVVPLVLATLVSLPLGIVGIAIKSCYSLNRAYAESLLQNEPMKVKEEARKNLEQAFQYLKLEKTHVLKDSIQLDKLLMKVLGRYGIRAYPTFDVSLVYLKAALQLHLQNIHHISRENLYSIATLDELLKKMLSFTPVVDFIKNANPDTYVQIVQKLNNREKIELAEIIRCLANCYSEKEQLGLSEEQYLDFKINIYEGVKKILESVKSLPEEVNRMIGELSYNNFPHLYLLKCKQKKQGVISKEDVEQTFKILDQALKYNPSLPMQARIAHSKGCFVDRLLKDALQQKKYFAESFRLWQKVLEQKGLYTQAEQAEHLSLYLMVNDNYFSILSDLRDKGEISIEGELEKYAEDCFNYYIKNKDQHPHVVIHLLNLAIFEKNNKIQALKYLNEIQRLSEKWKDWPQIQSYSKRAAAFKEELETV